MIPRPVFLSDRAKTYFLNKAPAGRLPAGACYSVQETINLLVDCHLHEATLSTDALDTDGGAGVRRDHIRKRAGRIPEICRVVEHGNGWQAWDDRRYSIDMESHSIGWAESERRVIGLNTSSPDSVIRAH